MNAYDYTKQKWVSGKEACNLRIEQLTQELDILKSERAEAYLRFNKSAYDLPAAIARCEAEIQSLKIHAINAE